MQISNKNYFIRNEELEELNKSIINRNEKICVISGLNATGKTSLWRMFLEDNKDFLDNKVEIIYTFHYNNKFPELSDKIKLVIFEEVGQGLNSNLTERINRYIDKYNEKQFIIVGHNQKYLQRFNPNTHIHLNPFKVDDTSKLLNKLIDKKVSPSEIKKIISHTKGNLTLIRIIADYLNSNKYSIEEIIKLITENIQYNSLHNVKNSTSNSGLIIDNTPELIHVTNDIKLINQDILNRIRRSPYDMHLLNPRQFEEMVAELMTRKGYNVDLTKATRDGGKDLIIANHLDIGNFIYYVECKKYAPTNPVGVNLVRELAGTITADRVTAGLMITSSYFSPDAIQFSEIFKNQISLIDFMKLKEWLTQL